MQKASWRESPVDGRNLRAELATTAELSTGTVILATFPAFCAKFSSGRRRQKMSSGNPIVIAE
jgi:hypothetical protein